jgi:hypothetical protein
MSSGSSFRTFPTSRLIFQAFISSAGMVSVGRRAGAPHRPAPSISHSPVSIESLAFDCVSPLQGVSIEVIQVLAGHKTITMSARYAHLSPEQEARASESIVVR